MAFAIRRPSWQAVKQGATGDTSLIVGAMAFQNILRIGTSMTLTRLLTAEAFAVVAIITSVLVTIGLVSDIGISAFIVRHERTSEREFADELWTLRLIRGIVLSVIAALVAVPAARLLGQPELHLVIAFAGLTFVLEGLQSLAPIIALRRRELRKLTTIDVCGQLVGTVILVGIAAWLRSYWAIIISNLIAQGLGIFLSYFLYKDSGQRWRFSKERAAELWHFSRFITISTTLTLIITQGDKLILARALPLETLGLYVIAAGLAGAPAGLVSSYASRVLYPMLAQVRREAPDTLLHRFYHDRFIPSMGYAFAAGGLIGFAPGLVALLYDPRYLDAGVLLRIMAISSFFAMGANAANELMIALGNTRFTYRSNVVRLTYMLGAGVVGWYVLGPIGVVWAVGTVELIAQIFGWIVLRRHGYLNMKLEAFFLSAGVAGFGVGYAVEVIARLLLHIR